VKRSVVIKKVLSFGVISAVISLTLAGFGFGVVEYYKIKKEALVKSHLHLDMLAYSLQPTLLRSDKPAPDQLLPSLREDQSISIKFVTYLLIAIMIIVVSIPASYAISAPIRRQVSEAVIQLELQSHRLRLLADQVVSSEQKERKRIAAIIHDHLQQMLVASKMQLDLTARRIENQEYDLASANLKRSEEYLSQAIHTAKSLTVQLHPPVLYEAGLIPAFQWLAEQFKKDHDLNVVPHLQEMPFKIPDNLKIMIFESVKELLFNVVKYANVNTAELFSRCEQGKLIILVKDQGSGFDVKDTNDASSGKGFGLFSIRERLKLIGGELRIVSQSQSGTQVEITVPIDRIVERSQNPDRVSKATKIEELSIERH
jgi:signal transduction histidine kinase